MKNQWIAVLILLPLALSILWAVYFIVRYAVLGKDTWPYSKNGPFNSTAQDMWEAEAFLEYEKKVPRP